jgi:hypothetical protein
MSMRLGLAARRTRRPERVIHVQLRLPPSLQKGLAAWAHAERSSLNALALALLERAVREGDVTPCDRESGEARR